MALEVEVEVEVEASQSQSEDFLNRVAQCEMEPGPPIEEISPQFFTPLNS